MKRISLVILSLFFASNFALADFFPLPPIANSSKTRVEAINKNSGKKLWEAVQTREIIYDKGKRFLSIVEEGHGYYGGAKEPTRWRFEGYYYTIPGLTPYYSSKTVSSESGEPLQTENLIYDHNTNKITYTREDFKDHRTVEKEMALNYDIIDNYALGVALLSYPFNEKKDFKFHQITEDQSIYPATIGYRGKERVTTAAGSFDTSKVELTVDLGVLSFVGVFLPKLYFWYTDGNPPVFVKYEGLESGLGTPYVIIQETDLKERK